MSAKSIGWENYIPTIALLAILAILLLLSLHSGIGKPFQTDVPSLSWLICLALLIIGLAAGFLGGLIGTGGCSVMLPAIHF